MPGHLSEEMGHQEQKPLPLLVYAGVTHLTTLSHVLGQNSNFNEEHPCEMRVKEKSCSWHPPGARPASQAQRKVDRSLLFPSLLLAPKQFAVHLQLPSPTKAPH